MSIDKAIARIDAGRHTLPGNPSAPTGLSDSVYWHEVREWLILLSDKGSGAK